jgi:hypothetical protein
MGSLAAFLQAEFNAGCPMGWQCRSEVHVLSPPFRKLLGYAPRADVLLEREDGSRRLWIEFEVSRADPVANHAKFATSHLFETQPKTDTFVAMVSSHVARGRRNLAGNTILLMRHVGMNAHQTLLLPQLPPTEIKRLNHLSLEQLTRESLDVRSELERVFSVSEPLAVTGEYRIHFVGDLLEVICNVRRWNEELKSGAGRSLWNKRTSVYFVYDPNSKQFAPAKFCAFLDASHGNREEADAAQIIMTMKLYTSLDETEPRFDGNRAQIHLQKNLGMKLVRPDASTEITNRFDKWLSANSEFIAAHPRGPAFLVPPDWFK